MSYAYGAGCVQQARKPHTACDRCHRLKERCTRQSITDNCGRCIRLELPCDTVRAPRRIGRRTKEARYKPNHPYNGDEPESLSSLGSTDPSPSPLDVSTWIADLEELNDSDKEKLLFLLDKPGNLDSYVVSPVFQDAERRSLAAPLPAALPVLKDAYLACAGALKSACARRHDAAESTDGHANLLHALAAMKQLRALPVLTPQDANLCLTLGASLTLYVYSAMGHGVYEISQHCLSMARPFVETGTLDAEAESWLTFLVFLEMVECLVHRRMPTLRTPQRQAIGSRNVVDRHLGLCTSLLPLYHDLCVVSHSLANTTDASYMAMTEGKLDQIQAEIEAWQPSQPDRFMDRFQSTEIVHLLTQARLYRLAALLVSHRLRHPFGQRDDRASVWANEIMSDLELARHVTERPARCVLLPFMVAAIEMRDLTTRRQALQNVPEYVDQFTPAVQKASRTFLIRVWWERDQKVTASWFDSTCKPCVLLSSLDTALFAD